MNTPSPFAAARPARRPIASRLGALFFLCAVSLLLTPMGCAEDGLIGGDCATGYAFCEGRCISVEDDEKNCGACNNACPRGLACEEGVCGGPDGNTSGGQGGMGGEEGTGGINVGAGGPGGRDTGGSSGDGGTGAGTGAVSGSGNAGGTDSGGADAGGTGGMAPCLPPYDTPRACGDCSTQCTDQTPNCAPTESGGFECVANCLEDPYTTECDGECVDTQTNPRHCGGCRNICPSGICVDGECVGATSGHLIALCMDLEVQSSQPIRLLQNSVFLAPVTPVRILGFVSDAGDAAETGTDAALGQAAEQARRSFELTKTSRSATVIDELTRANYDVFLVYDQKNAEAGELRQLGDDLASVIEAFTVTGGVVVVLTGGTGIDETTEFLDAIGFFAAQGTSDHTGKRFHLQAPGDAVGINVVSPFLGVSRSCVFESPQADDGALVFVVSDTDPDDGVGDPSVVHRIVVR